MMMMIIIIMIIIVIIIIILINTGALCKQAFRDFHLWLWEEVLRLWFGKWLLVPCLHSKADVWPEKVFIQEVWTNTEAALGDTDTDIGYIG